MILQRLALVTLVACGSHGSAASDSKIDSPPPLGDCGCDAPGSGSADAPMATADAATDAMTCDTSPSCPSGQWCTETAPIASTVLLQAVWAIDNNDVWAVGQGGTILRRRCNQWSVVDGGTTQNLHSVWASATDVWVVGDAGTILRYDGTTWTSITGVSTAQLNSIRGASSSDLWVVDSSGDALRFDGTSWTTRGVAGSLLGVAGTGDADVWVVGEAAYVHQANDAALWTNTTAWPLFKPEGNSGSSDYYAIVERSATNVWVASGSATTLQYNGSTWTAHSTGGTLFQSMWARADNDMWGAGQMKVGHWDGGSWTMSTPAGVTQALFGVAGTATDVYVVGGGATILHQD